MGNDKKVSKLHVFFYDTKVEDGVKESMSGQELKDLFHVPQERDLYLKHAENGKDLKILTSVVYAIKNGMHFVDAPQLGGGNGDFLPVPPLLKKHLDELIPAYNDYNVSRTEGSVIVEFPKFPMPEGIFNKNEVNLKVAIPLPYPQAALDMVWLEKDIRLLRGNNPWVTEQDFLGEKRVRISCHVKGGSWSPGRDNIQTFLSSVVDFLGRL